jgi:DNA-binding beta-propeller fold protein YncE
VVLAWSCAAADLQITRWDRAGNLAWTNAPVPGVCTIEAAAALGGPWTPATNVFSTNAAGRVSRPLKESNCFHRVRAVEVSPTPQGFTNLIHAFGLLETIAGAGEGQEDVNYWQPWFEGGLAEWASLSRPHFAMADRAGTVYIADKNSHAVLRVAPDGTVHTHAGTHVGGFDGDGPAAATNLQLHLPNGLWVRGDGTVYVLDTENGRVRRVTTNGVMSTLFLAKSDGSALGGGRGLWVRDDETLAYFGNTDRIRKWTPTGGLSTLASGFSELGTLHVEASGSLIACDRGGHYVYRVTASGAKTVIAGNGTAAGGGEGQPALATGLGGVRSAWPVPTGGWLLLLHDGCQLWYMDGAGILHLLLNGAGGRTHSGDGQYFYNPEEWRIGEGRSVTMDYAGNILICESDDGYVRRVHFQRVPPE